MKRTLLALAVVLAGVSIASAEEVELTSGERLNGRLAERTAELIVLDHPLLGRLEIPILAVRAIDGRAIAPAEKQTAARLKRADKAAAETMPEQVAVALPSAGPETPQRPPVEWDSQFELGLTARQGTTEDMNLRLGLQSERESPTNLTRLDAAYRLASSRGDRTENSFTAGLFSEWPWPGSRWSAFAQGRFDADEFESWDRRLTAGAGLGYRFFNITARDERGDPFDRFILTGRIGGGVRQEFGSDNEELSPEGLLGLGFTYGFSTRQRVIADTTLYPDFNETSEFRLVSNLDWTIDIDRLDGISLKLGVAHEYESQTDPGVPHNDLTAHALVVIDF